MKVAFAASPETVRLITAEGFGALSHTRTANSRIVLTEVDPRDPAALGGSAAVLLDIPDDQLSPFWPAQTHEHDTRTFEVPVSFAERFPIVASRAASPAARGADAASPAEGQSGAGAGRVPAGVAIPAPPGAEGEVAGEGGHPSAEATPRVDDVAGRLPRPQAARPRRDHAGKAKLIASIAAAAVVTAAMVSADAMTRDSIPVPRSTERVEIQVRSATLLLPSTRSELRRRRSRLTLRLRVSNISGRNLSLREPVLLVGRTRLLPDSKVRRTQGAFVSPLPRGAISDRVLRFRTKGSVTRRLIAGSRIGIRVGGQTFPVTRESLRLVPKFR